MEDLKQTLKECKNIDKVYVAENGAWYFAKPSNIETVEYGRDEILGDEKVISPLADKDKAVAGNAQKPKDEDKK